MSNLIDLNNVKEVCIYCKGSGIVTYPRNEIGTICSSCRGKGYYVIDASNIASISKATDIISADVYRLKTIYNLIRTFFLYEDIVLVKDIKYVAFANRGLLGTDKQWYEGPYTEGRIITYEEYLEGKFPLPDETSLSPQNFSDYPFDIIKDYPLTYTSEQRKNEWDNFYKECNSLEEKQEIVKKHVKSLKPRITF